MNKKLFLLLLCCALILSLCACNPHEPPSPLGSSTNRTEATDAEGSYTTGDLDTYYKTTIPLTNKTPSEIISEYNRLAKGDGDGGYPAAIFYQERPFSYQGKKVAELEPGKWTIAGTLKNPVYPWTRPKENFVSNCLPEGTVVYENSGDEKTMLAVSCENGFAVFE